jgi:hypothetical protein
MIVEPVRYAAPKDVGGIDPPAVVVDQRVFGLTAGAREALVKVVGAAAFEVGDGTSAVSCARCFIIAVAPSMRGGIGFVGFDPMAGEVRRRIETSFIRDKFAYDGTNLKVTK